MLPDYKILSRVGNLFESWVEIEKLKDNDKIIYYKLGFYDKKNISYFIKYN